MNRLLEWDHFAPAGDVYNLLKYWIAIHLYILQVRILVHLPLDIQILFQWKQLLFKLGNFFELMADMLVFLVVEEACEHE